MSEEKSPAPVDAAGVSTRAPRFVFPEPLASLMAGRERKPLGDHFGLTNFGVNLARLKPGSISAARHAHSRQDEFVYILEGAPTLVTNDGETPLRAGMCVGFKAGTGDAHHLVNRTGTDALYLEIGDRSTDDVVVYPDDDVALVRAPDGRRTLSRKDGSPL